MIKKNLTSSSSHSTRNNKKITPQQLSKKINQLYNENQKWKTRKNKIREQRQLTRSLEELKQCTFKPTINPQLSYAGTNNASFLKREEDWLNKKQRKIQQLSRDQQKKLIKQCSFHPTISQKTYTLIHNPTKYYNKNNKYSYAKNNVANSISNSNINLTNSINNSSKKSYKQLHVKKQNLKQLQKNNSVYEFNLITSKRNLLKIQEIQNQYDHDNQVIQFQFTKDSQMISINQSPIKQVNEKNFFQKRIEDQQTLNSIISSPSIEGIKSQKKQIINEPIQIYQQNQDQQHHTQQINNEMQLNNIAQSQISMTQNHQNIQSDEPKYSYPQQQEPQSITYLQNHVQNQDQNNVQQQKQDDCF